MANCQPRKRLPRLPYSSSLDGPPPVAIGSETDADALYVAEAVASLVDKSLIWNSEIGGSLYYRLLETTRAYAAAKLEESGQEEAVAKRHASYYVEYLKSASTGSTATD